MNEHKDFSSLPPELERTFIPFEKAAVENSKKAWRVAFVCCAVFLAAILTVVFSFEPPAPKMADDDMGALRPAAKKEQKEAPAATPEKPAAEQAPAEAPGGEAGEGE